MYNAVPPELTYIFLIDVSRDAAESKMLGYMINVIKDVFDREDLDLDDTLIYFYTYDDTVHEYDFSGDEAERTVIDFSLKPETKSPDNFLGNIKVKMVLFRPNCSIYWILWRRWHRKILNRVVNFIRSLNMCMKVSSTQVEKYFCSRLMKQ